MRNRGGYRREIEVPIRRGTGLYRDHAGRGNWRRKVRTGGRDRLRGEERGRCNRGRGKTMTRRGELCLMMGNRWWHRDGGRL